MKLIDWAKQADIEFRSNPLTYEDIDFDLPAARVFYIDKNDRLTSHSFHGDIYDGLNLVMRYPIPDCQIIGIETCGWAAPLNPDGEPCDAPSEHPARRRVRMVTVCDALLNLASLIVFQDDPNPLTDEDGDATGHLAVALSQAMVISTLAASFPEMRE